MTTRMHRTQILLEPGQHKILTQIAQQEQRSLSDVIRQMLQTQIDQRTRDTEARKQRQLEALERIQQHKQAIRKRRNNKPLEIDPVTLINQMRDERDEDIIRGGSHDRG